MFGFNQIAILYYIYFIDLGRCSHCFGPRRLQTTRHIDILVNMAHSFVLRCVWAFSTLLTGIITVLAYWSIHHSSLRRAEAPWTSDVSPQSEKNTAEQGAAANP